MHPILFWIGSLPIYFYGFFMALGIVLGMFWLGRRAKKDGFSPDRVTTIAVIMVLAGIAGAKLLYLAYFPELLQNPLAALTERGGLVWYGGLIGASLSALVMLKLSKLPVLRFADWVMPPLALGLLLGRIGCFMSGCCYGSPCALPWAVRFPRGHETFPDFVHPTQLYEALGALVLLGLILFCERRFSGRYGLSFALFLVGYGCLRFGIEMLRADAYVVGLLSASQWLSLLCVVVGGMIGLAVSRSARRRATSDESTPGPIPAH